MSRLNDIRRVVATCQTLSGCCDYVLLKESPCIEYSRRSALMVCADLTSSKWAKRGAGLVRVQLKDSGFDDQSKGTFIRDISGFPRVE